MLFGVVAGLILAMALELLAPRDQRPASVVFGFVMQILFALGMAGLAWALGAPSFAAGLHPLFPPVEQWAGPLALPVSLIVTDFFRYVEHRVEHRFWWRVHRVHHSFTDLHAANSFGHPLQALPTFAVISVPLVLLNFQSVATPLAVFVILMTHTFYIHSPTRLHLGRLRYLVVDNRFHRIHHSLEERHFDRNFGVLFTVWDQLFGTAYFPDRAEWPAVGVAGIEPPRTTLGYLLAPLGSGDGNDQAVELHNPA